MGQEKRAMDIRLVEICPLVWLVKILDFCFQPPCLCRIGEQMISECVFPTMKHAEGVMVLCWWHCQWFEVVSLRGAREQRWGCLSPGSSSLCPPSLYWEKRAVFQLMVKLKSHCIIPASYNNSCFYSYDQRTWNIPLLKDKTLIIMQAYRNTFILINCSMWKLGECAFYGL
jgi:hypothetical protein